MTPPRLTVVGSLNLDLIVRVARFPRPGETLLGADFITAPGGKGANQAVAAARLGAEVRMVGRVGDDPFGGRLLMALDEAEVDRSAVLTTSGVATGVAMITVAADGENQIVVATGANAALTPADLTAAGSRLGSADLVISQLEVPSATVAAAAREAGRFLLNAAPADRVEPTLLEVTDVLVVNRGEAQALTGDGDPARAARRLTELGPTLVVVTLGPEGSVVVADGTLTAVAAFPVQAVDTTAAGDAFVGALAVALAEGNDPVAAVRWASAAGALATTVVGAQPSLPTRTAVEELAGT